MKSITTVATLALIAAATLANAAPVKPVPGKPVDICVANQVANAAIIAKAQAAKTPEERKAILDAAIKANPANAVCIADLALQLAQANSNISPAAGPEEGGTDADFGTGTGDPAENPNQLNQPAGSGTNSPAAPVLQ